MNIRDTLERLFWTVIAAMGGALIAPEILSVNISTLEAAAIAGLSAAVNFVTLVAREKLAVVPDPGAGLPGLPT